MKGLKIALDCDGVLSIFDENFCRLLRRHGIWAWPHMIRRWDYHEDIGCDAATFKKAFDQYFETNLFVEQSAYPEAEGVLADLDRRGHGLAIFTTRPEGTRRWIQPPYPTMHYTLGPVDKVRRVREWSADLFLDDNRETIQLARKQGMSRAYLLRRPWNCPPDDNLLVGWPEFFDAVTQAEATLLGDLRELKGETECK